MAYALYNVCSSSLIKLPLYKHAGIGIMGSPKHHIVRIFAIWPYLSVKFPALRIYIMRIWEQCGLCHLGSWDMGMGAYADIGWGPYVIGLSFAFLLSGNHLDAG